MFPARETLVSDIPARDGRIVNLFFTVCGRVVPSLGIYVSNFRYSIFAVCFIQYILIFFTGSDVPLARRGRTS